MVVKKVSDLGLRDAGKGFLISLRASNRYSPAYLEALERTIALVALYAEEHGWPNVPYLTTSHIEEYMAYFQERPIYFGERAKANPKPSQGYIEVQYRRLKRFFNWLVERDHLDRNPLHLIPHPHIDEKVVATVSDDDMLRLLLWVDPRNARTAHKRFRMMRDQAVLYLLWDTPCRRNEIAGLGVDDVDWDEGGIRVMGKGRKQRWMPVGSKVAETLWGYLQLRDILADRHVPALWVSEQGSAMKPNWLYLMLKRLGQRADVPHLHTHRFRHTYAINALEAGMPERVLTVNMGTKRIPDTYFRTLGEKEVARKHREISPADRLGEAQATQRRERGPWKGRGRL